MNMQPVPTCQHITRGRPTAVCLPLAGGVLTTLKLSRDQQQVAYGVASSTGEQQACIVRDLRTGEPGTDCLS
jgi:hypothetical protein